MATDLPFQNIFLKINLQTFQQLTHLCLDELCGRQGAKFDNFKDSVDCSTKEFSTAVTEIKSGLSTLIRRNASKTELPDVTWGDLDPGYVACLHESLDVRPKDVQAFKLNSISSLAGPTLKDFDWNVKWVLGSSSLSSLQEPLVTLDLSLSDNTSHSLEMNTQEVTKLIASLEKAQDAVQSKPH